MQPFARYREFDPCAQLRGAVRCFFTFTSPVAPDDPRRPIRREILHRGAPLSYITPLFADSQVSISFCFGAGYRVDGLWDQASAKQFGHVIGPMSAARPAAHGERIIQVGAYLRPLRAKCFFGTPARELANRILPLSDCWGKSTIALEADIAEARSDEERVGQLERAMLQRLRADSKYNSGVDLPTLAAFVQEKRGVAEVGELAASAGISRQHLGRLFREEVGMPPKLFCRLARFRSVLACVGRGATDGAGLAAELGYVDQSHMIAEFREFSGLTPKPFLLHQRVHPFMDTIATTTPPAAL